MKERMNSFSIRQYWCSKYESKFGKEYPKDKLGIELSFIKKAVNKYGYYSVLETIDSFLGSCSNGIASIIYFANPRYYEDKFRDILRTNKIAKYRRFSNSFPAEIKDEVKGLIQDYVICSHEMASDYDVIRRNEILGELEVLTRSYFASIEN